MARAAGGHPRHGARRRATATGRSSATRTSGGSRATRRRSARAAACSSATRRPSCWRRRSRSWRWTPRGTRSCAAWSRRPSRRARSSASRTGSARARRQVVEEAAPTGGGDFVELVAKRLPLMTISDMVGVPEADRERIVATADVLVTAQDPEGQRRARADRRPRRGDLGAHAVRDGARRPPRAPPRRRPHDRARPGRGRRRAPDPRGDRRLLRPAGGRRERHDAAHHLARDAGADDEPRPARPPARGPRGPDAGRRRGVRALGLGGPDLPAHGHARRRAPRDADRRGPEGRALLPLGQPRRDRLRRTRSASTSRATRTTTSASAAAARTTAWAPRWRARSCARSSPSC